MKMIPVDIVTEIINYAREEGEELRRVRDRIVTSDNVCEAEPVRSGKWIFEKGDGVTCMDGWRCTVCNETYHTRVPYFSDFNFCPECGARMEK